MYQDATFGRAAIEVDDNIRRHVTKEYMDHVLSPLKHVVVDQIPLLKQQHLERHGYERDVASCSTSSVQEIK